MTAARQALAIACALGASACAEDRKPEAAAPPPPAPAPPAPSREQEPIAELDDLDVPPAFPTPTPAAVAHLQAATKIALDMCKKEQEAVTPADVRAYEPFVAALPMPPATAPPPAEDELKATQDAYLAAGTYPFVATGAAIHIWGGDTFAMMVVGDGSDPCKANEATYLTEKGNPALKLTQRSRLGEQGSNIHGPTQIQEGAGFVRIDELEKGKGAKLTIHACFDQEPTLQVWSAGVHLPVRYFAIGPLEATWCPDAEP